MQDTSLEKKKAIIFFFITHLLDMQQRTYLTAVLRCAYLTKYVLHKVSFLCNILQKTFEKKLYKKS
jgi:hypothetical protein